MVTRRDFTLMGVGLSALGPSVNRLMGAGAPGTVPSEGADIRRVGVRPNGVYWGADSEHIDVLSGNLNFTVDFIKAGGRGVKATLALSYNSQLWKSSLAGLESFGTDVGFGFGWNMQVGAIKSNLRNGVISYTYFDRTGAGYPLTQTSEGWVSLQGLWIMYDPTTARLYFPNGTEWAMGCVSAPGESDAGTRYPTLIQDQNGNQIFISYMAGAGSVAPDSSARILRIRDARAVTVPEGRATFSFVYSRDSSSMPRLTSIISHIGTDESSSFSFVPLHLRSPFADQTGAGLVQMLERINLASGLACTFAYGDSAEMTQCQTPHGGILNWKYGSASFAGGQKIREVVERSAAISAGGPLMVYRFDRKSNAAEPIHCETALDELNGAAKRIWTFYSDTVSVDLGLLSSFDECDGSGKPLRRSSFLWGRDSNGTPYVNSSTLIRDPTTPGQTLARTQIDRDSFGNVTQKREFERDLSTPARVTTYTYLRDPAYLSRYLRNRLTSLVISDHSVSTELVRLRYDTTPLVYRSGVTEHDSTNFDISNNIRGNITESISGALYNVNTYDVTGFMCSVRDQTGWSQTITPAEGTNNSRPGLMVTNGDPPVATKRRWNVALQKLNKLIRTAEESIAYDLFGRRSDLKMTDGAMTHYTYAINPTTVTSSRGERWKKMFLDGFGRVTLVQRGDSSGVQTLVETEYGAAPNAPLGRVVRSASIHAVNTPPQWVNYSWDALGRIISQG